MTILKNGSRLRVTMVVATTLALCVTVMFGACAKKEQVIKITAKKFEYTPNEIKIKKGVSVVLEFTSLDRTHGFTIPTLGGLRATIEPGKVTRVPLLVQKAGVYNFHCDIFCGEGHEGMTGKIIVED